MIYIENITSNTAKSADYLGNAGCKNAMVRNRLVGDRWNFSVRLARSQRALRQNDDLLQDGAGRVWRPEARQGHQVVAALSRPWGWMTSLRRSFTETVVHASRSIFLRPKSAVRASAHSRPPDLDQKAAAQSVKAAVRRACEPWRGRKVAGADGAAVHCGSIVQAPYLPILPEPARSRQHRQGLKGSKVYCSFRQRKNRRDRGLAFAKGNRLRRRWSDPGGASHRACPQG